MSSPADAEAAQVAATLSSFVQAVRNADLENLSPHFADDVTIFTPADPTLISGRAAVEGWSAAGFGQVRALRSGPPYLNAVPQDIQIRVEGAVAVATFRYLSEAPLSRRTFIFRRTPAGWRVMHVHADDRPQSE